MKDIIIKTLEMLLISFKSDNSNLSEKDLLILAECIAKINTEQKTEYCRTEVIKYLRISKASLDNYVKKGMLPKGNKLPGKGPIWYKRDLDLFLDNYGYKEAH
jgi:predicted DNA-binding transcriptional regulator AlpA